MPSDESSRRKRPKSGKKEKSEEKPRKRKRSSLKDPELDAAATEASETVAPPRSSVYIPPALRGGEKTTPIEAQIKSILNKLSIGNFSVLAKEIVALFHGAKASHNELITVLIRGTLNNVADPVQLNVTTVLPYAALWRVLQVIIGREVVALLLHEAVVNLFEYLQHDEMTNKGYNVSFLVCLLTLLRTVDTGVVRGLVHFLITEPTEGRVRVLLLVLKVVSPLLRAEDPQSLKEIVEALNVAVARQADNTDLSMRMRFLVDMVNDAKAGRRSRDEHIADLTRQIGKKVREFLNAEGRTENPILQLTWELVLDPPKKPRWWDAALKTAGLVEDDVSAKRARLASPQSDREGTPASLGEPETALPTNSSKDDWAQLYRAHNMNTVVRKAAFKAITDASDFVDCFQKLAAVGIKKNQYEIAHVLVHCCLQEKVFNRFYCVLARKIVGSFKPFRFAINCALWDQLKVVETAPLVLYRMVNLARFVCDLLKYRALSLEFLKILDLDSKEPGEKLTLLLRILFLHIGLLEEKQLLDVMVEMTHKRDLQNLRVGLKEFVEKLVIESFEDFSEQLLVVLPVQPSPQHLLRKLGIMRRLLEEDPI